MAENPPKGREDPFDFEAFLHDAGSAGGGKGAGEGQGAGDAAGGAGAPFDPSNPFAEFDDLAPADAAAPGGAPGAAPAAPVSGAVAAAPRTPASFDDNLEREMARVPAAVADDPGRATGGGAAPIGEDPFASVDGQGDGKVDVRRLEDIFNQAEEDQADDLDGEAGDSKLRRFWPIGVGVGALAAFGGIVYYTYVSMRGPDAAAPKQVAQAPLIRAEQGPTRIRPDEPGGKEIPNQDSILLNQKGGAGQGAAKQETIRPQAEAILPRPEPTTVPAGSPPPPPLFGRDAKGGQPVARQEPAEPAEAQPSSMPPSPLASGGRSAPAAGMPVATKPTDLMPVREVGEARAKAPPAEAATTAPAGAKAARPAPVQQAAKPAETAAQKAAPADGGFRVQIASYRDTGAVKANWDKLQKQHQDLLGSLDMNAERADLGARGTFYRLQAGPFSSKDAAQTVCNQLKQRSIDCIVVRS
ncbi:MAG: SPOR domain-containing protein [Alphaproteobacteria bacterium]|nr:SPOR domain-containing protein [Alphaproteobacteria bacterium]